MRSVLHQSRSQPVGPAMTRTCRGCGCDDDHACVQEVLTRHGPVEVPCAWVLLDIAEPTGICSACADEMEWHPMLLATAGRTSPALSAVRLTA